MIDMTVLETHSCRSSYGRLQYLFQEPPHSYQKTSRRVLACSGFNIKLLHEQHGRIANTQNGAYLEKQFKANLQKAHNPKRKYQAQTLIISFSPDEFDTTDLSEQANQALMLVKHYVHQHFADAQSVIAIQADGDGGKLHAHVVFNTVRPNGRTVPTNRFNIYKLRTNFDHEMIANYQRVTGNSWTNPISKQQKRQDIDNIVTRSQWQKSLKKIINQVKNEVDSLREFVHLLGTQGITITERKKGTAWTYHQTINGKEYKVRDFYQRVKKQTGEVISTRGLGQSFTKSNLEQCFAQKQEERTNNEQNEQLAKIKTMAADARARSQRQQQQFKFNQHQLQATKIEEQEQRDGLKTRQTHRRQSQSRRLEELSRQKRRAKIARRLATAKAKSHKTASGPDL